MLNLADDLYYIGQRIKEKWKSLTPKQRNKIRRRVKSMKVRLQRPSREWEYNI